MVEQFYDTFKAKEMLIDQQVPILLYSHIVLE